MNPKIGIMQGRLSKPPNGKVQSFPKDSWKNEFYLAKEIGFQLIERILQRVKNVKKKQFYYQHQKKFTMINLINSYFFILRW